MRILVAEDDAPTRALIRRVLEREGFEVVLAVDGIDALDAFHRSRPDIVITDHLMPRRNGLELCLDLAAARGSRFVPILMLTAGQDPGLLRASLQAGALEFLNKPVQPEELVARVRAIAAMTAMHHALADSQEETQGELAVVKHLLERLTRPGLSNMPAGFAMGTLQTVRINGDATCYRMGIGGTHLGLLCDATGHGLVAGVSTLPVIEAFEMMASRDIPLESIYLEVNAKLCRLLPADRFACLVLLRLDPERGHLRVLNAGMPDVLLLRRDGLRLRAFGSRNFPAGIVAQPEAVQVEDVSVAPGDRVFSASDGLLDLFGEPLQQRTFLRRGMRFPVPQDHAWLKRQVERTLANAEQHDDITWALWEVPPPTPLPVDPHPSTATPAAPTQGSLGLALHFELDPRIHPVREMVPYILGLLGFKGVASPVLQQLGILLTEALNNAVDHGLLRLDSGLKREGFEAYEDSRLRALQAFQGGLARCSIGLFYSAGPTPRLHHLHVDIADDGSGFDWFGLLEAPVDDLAPYGRGLALIRSLAQDLTFNPAGNALAFNLAC